MAPPEAVGWLPLHEQGLARAVGCSGMPRKIFKTCKLTVWNSAKCDENGPFEGLFSPLASGYRRHGGPRDSEPAEGGRLWIRSLRAPLHGAFHGQPDHPWGPSQGLGEDGEH